MVRTVQIERDDILSLQKQKIFDLCVFRSFDELLF